MIALIGGNSYVGSSIARELRNSDIRFMVIRRSELDCCNEEILTETLERNGISFVINAAGYTGKPNVDACERFKSECFAGNVVLPRIIRSTCRTIGIPFGHVSSGRIFNGHRLNADAEIVGFNEEDIPNFCFGSNNCSFYSGSKELGESVLSGCDNCYIWRLRMPFNNIDSYRNYLSKLLWYPKLLDVRNSLTHLDEFAKCCVDCVRHKVPYGIYNLTNGGSVTTRQVAEMLTTIDPDRTFRFFENEAGFMNTVIAPRSNCVLDNSKAIATGLMLSPIEAALEHAIANWK